MDLKIKALTPDLKADYLNLFDHMIHVENPDWAKCYCNDYHFLGDVESCTKAMSRAMIIDRIEADELNGYLVYAAERPVGWCNVNNRANYQRLLRDYELDIDPEEKVCAVVCFLIHPDFRRKGLSQKLLEKIITDYARLNYDFVEAYPRKTEASSNNFNGPLELYKRNGFTVFRENEKYFVMRRALH